MDWRDLGDVEHLTEQELGEIRHLAVNAPLVLRLLRERLQLIASARKVVSSLGDPYHELAVGILGALVSPDA